MTEEKREKFLQIYAHIPDGLRKDIIVVVDDKPYTWDAVYFEIKNKTILSKKMLKELENNQTL
jgi:hypothetical protein